MQQFGQLFHIIDAASLLEGEQKSRFEQKRVFFQSKTWRLAAIDATGQREQIFEQLAAEKAQTQRYFDQLVKGQASFHSGIDHCKAVLSEIGEGINNLNEDLVLQGELQYQALCDLGFEMDSSFAGVLSSSEKVQAEVGIVVEYIQSQRAQQIESDRRRQTQMSFQGLHRSFGFLNALGQAIDSPELSKVAVICQEGVTIAQTLSSIPDMVGMAVLNPYAAIGMSVMKIASVFGVGGKDSSQVMLEQIQAIGRQMQANHQEVIRQFQGVHEHLSMMARMIKYVSFMITVPVLTGIDDIKSLLDSSIALIKMQGNYQALNDLRSAFTVAHQICRGVRPSDIKELSDLLSTAYRFLAQESYSPMFNGRCLLESIDLPVVKKIQVLDKLRAHPQHISGYLAQHWMSLHRLSAQEEIALPNTEIWLTSMAVYMMVRMHMDVKYPGSYDPSHVELNDILALAQQSDQVFEVLFRDDTMIESLLEGLDRSREIVIDGINKILLAAERGFRVEHNRPLFRCKLGDILKLDKMPICGLGPVDSSQLGSNHRDKLDSAARALVAYNQQKGVIVFTVPVISKYLREHPWVIFEGVCISGSVSFCSPEDLRKKILQNSEDFFGIELVFKFKRRKYHLTKPAQIFVEGGVLGRQKHPVFDQDPMKTLAAWTVVDQAQVEVLHYACLESYWDEGKSAIQTAMNNVDAFLKQSSGDYAQYQLMQRYLRLFAEMRGCGRRIQSKLNHLTDRSEHLCRKIPMAWTEFEYILPSSEDYRAVMGLDQAGASRDTATRSNFIPSFLSPVREQVRLGRSWLADYRQTHHANEDSPGQHMSCRA